MGMKFALWETKLLGNCLWWILMQMNCLTRWEQFLSLYTYNKLDTLYTRLSCFVLAFRRWLKIKVMSGLPNTRDKRQLHEIKAANLWKLCHYVYIDLMHLGVHLNFIHLCCIKIKNWILHMLCSVNPFFEMIVKCTCSLLFD